MITFKNAKNKTKILTAAAFAGFMLVNGMNVSAYESVQVEGAPAAVAGAVYEQANIYEEAAQSAGAVTEYSAASKDEVVTEYSAASKNEAVTEYAQDAKTVAVDVSSNDIKTLTVGGENEVAALPVNKDTEDLITKDMDGIITKDMPVAEDAAAGEPAETTYAAADTADAASVTYEVPEYSGNKSYESYRVIRRGKAGTLQMMATTNADGFRMVHGRYLVAVGTYFGAARGQYIDLTLENGTVIPCIVGDMKAAEIFSANGCCSEFIVDTGVIRNVVSSGDVSDYRADWNSPVDTITVHNTFAL